MLAQRIKKNCMNWFGIWNRITGCAHESRGAIFLELLEPMQKDFRSLSHLRFAAIGEGTASVCREHGIYPDYIPERFYAADLGKGLAKRVKQNERVCILRARYGSPELTQAFEAAGISYMDVTLTIRSRRRNRRLQSASVNS